MAEAVTSITYRCGCREDRQEGLPRRCPIHGEPAKSAVLLGKACCELAFGPGSYPVLPVHGLFWPYLGATP